MVPTTLPRDRLNLLVQKKLRILLNMGRDSASRINWDQTGFDQEKARCLALFSEIAYYKITEEEHRRPARAKLIPCETFQNAVITGVRIDFDTLIRQAELRAFDVIETRNFVAIVCYLQNVVVVAVRGTAFLYDWRANLRCMKSRYGDPEQPLRFHTGFLREARILAFRLYERLRDRINLDDEDEIPIILTGHSLGGAISAILCGIGINKQLIHGIYYLPPAKACYTYAAPRYAGFDDLVRLENPYNCINDFDLVPRVPPIAFGYSNSMYEFDLKGAPYTAFSDSTASRMARWLLALITGTFLHNHSMETYRRKIRASLRVVRVPRPPRANNIDEQVARALAMQPDPTTTLTGRSIRERFKVMSDLPVEDEGFQP
jgi:hypothetical protein